MHWLLLVSCLYWGCGGKDSCDAASPVEGAARAAVASPRCETPLRPPVPAGAQPDCADAPDLARVLRALPPTKLAMKSGYEVYRDDISLVVEKLVDRVDPVRFFPLIGPAQLHHQHWKCTVHFTETVVTQHPVPTRTRTRQTQVVYIDTDHLHTVAGTPEDLERLNR